MGEQDQNGDRKDQERERERVDAGDAHEVDSGPGLTGGYGGDPEAGGDDKG